MTKHSCFSPPNSSQNILPQPPPFGASQSPRKKHAISLTHRTNPRTQQKIWPHLLHPKPLPPPHKKKGGGRSVLPKMFAAGGKLIGLALLHGEPVPSMKLSRPLRRLLLGSSVKPLEEQPKRMGVVWSSWVGEEGGSYINNMYIYI